MGKMDKRREKRTEQSTDTVGRGTEGSPSSHGTETLRNNEPPGVTREKSPGDISSPVRETGRPRGSCRRRTL